MYSKITTSKKFVFNAILIIALLINIDGSTVGISNRAFADEQTADTVSINETQKQIFSEAKKASNEDKNTRNSLFMIAGVLALVGVAMYLAFKSDDGEKKQNFARTPKKNF